MNGAEKLQHSSAENASVPFPESREQSTTGVAERLEQLLGSLEEALEYYKEVTLPDGSTIEAVNEHERRLARAQVFQEAVRGLVEQMREQNNHYAEKAAAKSESAVSHVVGLLSDVTDLWNEAERNPAAARLALVLGNIAFELLPQEAGEPGKAH